MGTWLCLENSAWTYLGPCWHLVELVRLVNGRTVRRWVAGATMAHGAAMDRGVESATFALHVLRVVWVSQRPFAEALPQDHRALAAKWLARICSGDASLLSSAPLIL